MQNKNNKSFIRPFPRNTNVKRLQKWLNYEVLGASTGFFILFYSWGYLVLIGAATIFIPILLKILYNEGRYGWIIFLFCFVVIPSTLVFFFLDIEKLGIVLPGVPLALFILYCVLLKITIPSRED